MGNPNIRYFADLHINMLISSGFRVSGSEFKGSKA